MPRVLELTDPEYGSSGIQITWTPSARRLDFFGWYDSCVGIQGDSFSLREFFDKLGINKKDCEKAFEETTCPSI